MDACTCPDSVPQGFNCKSCVHCFSLNSELPHVGTKDSLHKDVGFLQPIVDVDGHTDDTSNVSDLVNLFKATLQVHDVNSTVNGQLKILHLNLDQNDTYLTNGDGNFDDVKICQLDACNISSMEISERSDAFPCKQEVILHSLSDNMTGGALCMTTEREGSPIHGHESNVPSNITHVSSNIYQKLISAMKGSREKQGLAPKAKMNVKWAPDVYDPPVTLVSHTVKGSLRRSRAKKDKHRQKHKGGKVSRTSYTGRKQSNRNMAINDDLQLRLQGPTESLLLSASASSATKLVEFALNTNESKCCGSSFLINPLGKVQLPVGKAS